MFKCKECSTWFKTKSQAERHSFSNHSKRSSIIDTEAYFRINGSLKTQWETAVLLLTGDINLSIKSSQSPCDTLHSTEPIYYDDEDNMSRILTLNETTWHSIGDVKCLIKKAFLICGDWQQLGKMIQSSSISNVKQACFEIKDCLLELITHPRACHSTATLFFNCDTGSWNYLLELLQSAQIRSKLYDSIEAGHFFPKVDDY